MAKPARRQPPLPPAPSAPEHPPKAALARISACIARGYDASRLCLETAALLSDWAARIEADDLREYLDEVHGELSEGVEAAENMGSEIETGDAASVKLHQRSLGALMAARDAFGQAVQRL